MFKYLFIAYPNITRLKKLHTEDPICALFLPDGRIMEQCIFGKRILAVATGGYGLTAVEEARFTFVDRFRGVMPAL
jgi:hypothetical protein